jgi:hypothetical protein
MKTYTSLITHTITMKTLITLTVNNKNIYNKILITLTITMKTYTPLYSHIQVSQALTSKSENVNKSKLLLRH